jgi:RND family efflux transporter MFP subunit
MRKLVFPAIIVIFVLAVLLRIAVISSLAGREAPGIEYYYRNNGVPVEVETVRKGEFVVLCRVNALVHGLRQTQIVAQTSGKILRVNHEVGDRVEADEVIVSLDREDPRSSAQYRQLKAVYETTLLNYRRILELRDSGAVSQSELDQAKMQLDVDRANLESVVEAVALSSPIDGTILDINAREGELVTPSRPVAVVAQTDRVRLTAEVSESDIRNLEVGQRVFVENGSKEAPNAGSVTRVTLNADPRTGLFRIEMEVENRGSAMKVGTYTTAQVEVVRDEQALYADLRALQQEPDGSYFVYAVSGEEALKTPVRIAGMNDDFARILSGLSESDAVVVKGFTRLGDGVKVLF